MKSKKSSPWVAAGAGCLIGILLSILAIAILTFVGVTGGLIRIISYLPFLTTIIAFFWARNRQIENEIRAQANPPDLQDKVLESIIKGLSNLEIAEKLGVSAVQVSVIKTKLMEKFGVKNETEMIEEARRRGYLPTGDIQNKSDSTPKQ